MSNCHCVECHQLQRTTIGTKSFFGEFLDHARRRAKDGCFPFNLSKEYLSSIWPDDGLCPVLGVEMKPNPKTQGPNSPTLDRLDPTKGYVEGNVAFICAKANTLKNDETNPEVLRRLADWLEKELQRTQ